MTPHGNAIKAAYERLPSNSIVANRKNWAALTEPRNSEHGNNNGQLITHVVAPMVRASLQIALNRLVGKRGIDILATIFATAKKPAVRSDKVIRFTVDEDYDRHQRALPDLAAAPRGVHDVGRQRIAAARDGGNLSSYSKLLVRRQQFDGPGRWKNQGRIRDADTAQLCPAGNDRGLIVEQLLGKLSSLSLLRHSGSALSPN